MTQTHPELEPVRQRFLEQLATRRIELNASANAVENTPDKDLVFAQLRTSEQILHKIAGTAGILGFEALGIDASHCEQTIHHYLQSSEVAARSHTPLSLRRLLQPFSNRCDAVLAPHRRI